MSGRRGGGDIKKVHMVLHDALLTPIGCPPGELLAFHQTFKTGCSS